MNATRSLKPPLEATLPFESAKRLTRPFKPPFKKKSEDNQLMAPRSDPYITVDKVLTSEPLREPEDRDSDMIYVEDQTTKRPISELQGEPPAKGMA